MPRHTVRPASVKRPKSTPAARRLIRAALKRHNTIRAAAYALRLGNHMQLVRMLRGQIRDTLEMKAALARADERARRAWEAAPARTDCTIDPAAIRAAVAELKTTCAYLESLLPE